VSIVSTGGPPIPTMFMCNSCVATSAQASTRSEASLRPRSGDRGKAIRASFARAFDAGVRDADPDRHELAVPRDRRLPPLGLPGTDTERPDVADKPHRDIVRQAVEVGS